MTASRLLLAALAVSLAACSELPKRDPAKAGPFFTASNVTKLGRLPIELRRVVALPASSGPQVTDESLDRIDRAISEELNRTGKFEVVTATRADLKRLFGVTSIASTDALPRDFFEKITQAFAADGVLLTDVTSFSAYPPLLLGLRVKLARVSDREIIWAGDNTFSGSEPAVANSARRYALQLGADRGPGDLSHTILQNPSRFASFAAATTFAALPPR